MTPDNHDFTSHETSDVPRLPVSTVIHDKRLSSRLGTQKYASLHEAFGLFETDVEVYDVSRAFTTRNTIYSRTTSTNDYVLD